MKYKTISYKNININYNVDGLIWNLNSTKLQTWLAGSNAKTLKVWTFASISTLSHNIIGKAIGKYFFQIYNTLSVMWHESMQQRTGGKYQVGIIVESIDFWASCVQNVFFFFFKKQKFKQTNPTKYVAEAVAAIKCQCAKSSFTPQHISRSAHLSWKQQTHWAACWDFSLNYV